MTDGNQLRKEDIAQIREETLPDAINKKGMAPDTSFFAPISTWFKQFAQAAATSESWWAQYLRSVGLGGALAGGALIGAKLGSIFGITGLVIGAIAGGTAGLALGAVSGLVFSGDNPVGTVQKIINATGDAAKATTTLFVSSAIANTAGITIPQLVQGLLNFGETIYDFNFDIPDSEIWKQINSIIDGLYGQAGQFLGSSFMRFIITGTLAPPKIQIDVRGIALAYSDYTEEKRKQLLDGVSNFAWIGLNAAKRIGFLFAFLSGRNAIKQAILAMPGIEELMPDLYKLATEWGDEENPNTPESEVKDWRISTWVEQKVESIADPRIKSFVEGFLEGAHDVIEDDVMDYVEFKYA
jgi:hypothetical protein